MSPLSLLRGLVPVCLALGVLLGTRSALAAPPAAPAVGTEQARTIPLQHTVPSDMLKTLRWDQATGRFGGDSPLHVEGVTQLRAMPETNSLAVVATSAGFAQVKELVKLLDIAPLRVKIQFALAHAALADLKASGISFDLVPMDSPQPGAAPVFEMYAAGKPAVQLLQALTKQGAVTQAPLLTTANNVGSSIRISTMLPSQRVLSETFAATPRVNSDNSVTLALHAVFADGAVKREIKTLRTVKSGGTMVIVMPSDATGVGGKTLLLFITPTLLDLFSAPVPASK